MSVPRDPTGKLLFTSSSYCALCRKTLPKPNYEIGFVPPPNDAWKYKVVGLYNIGIADKPSRIVAAFGDFADAICFEELAVNFASVHSLVLKVRTKYPISDKDRIAHLVHLPCWKLIRVLDPSLTLRSIYEFAQSTYSLFNTTHVPEGQDITTTVFTGVINENANQSDVGEFLNHLSRLPLELQLAIPETHPSNLLSSLITVAHTTSTLISAFKCSQGQLNVELICHSDVKTLCAETVTIFGNKYISSLRFNELSESSEKLEVRESEVTGIKFAIGRYGVKALRICYASNESSDWLGDPRAGWIGVIHGSDITSLRILCDDLKCIRIDFMHDSPTKEQPRLFFDKDLSFRSIDHHRILDTGPSPQIRNFPKWRMCRYLPFFDGEGYMSSLTMYCDGHSITGMAASGLSFRSIGEWNGYRHPIHLYFQPDKRIESIWLRMPYPQSDSWHRPNIMVLTNLNRTQIFGPSLVPGAGFHEDGRYQWTLLTQDPGSRPTGIFVDALRKEGGSSKFDNIGVTQHIRPREVQGIYPMIPELGFELYTRELGRSIVDCYLTIASFAHVKELRVSRTVSKTGPRISGMAIHHHNGSIDVLGKWCSLPLGSPSKIEQIYHCKNGTLTSIAFGFSGDEDGPKSVDTVFLAIDHKPRIEDVVPKSKLVEIFLVVEMDPPTVMWLFNFHHDHIGPWDGEYLPPNMSSQQYRITEF